MAAFKINSIAATSSALAIGYSPNGEAGAPVIRGTADPRSTVVLYDTPPTGAQTQRQVVADANGNWVFDYGEVPYLTSGTHFITLVATAPSLLTSFIYETVLVGSKAADTLFSPGAFDRRNGSDLYVLGGEGNDSISAYTGSPSQLGIYTPNNVSIDGQSGTDTVLVPTQIARSSGSVRSGASLKFSTADANVTITNVEKLSFSDYTVTVRLDPLVDSLFYDKTYADIATYDVDPRTHYAVYGWRESRNPNGFFNTGGYLAAYKDIAAAGVNPLQHYDGFGWKEGRDPSAGFDTNLYLRFNPDVRAAGIDPLAHWLQYGQAEGRKSAPAVGSTIDNGFDATFYILSHGEIGRAGLDPKVQFHTEGWKQGYDPNALFSTSSYLAQNPDVKASAMDPLEHYMTYGWKEGRDPSRYFSTQKYLAAYKDVAAAGVNPLQHFLTAGLAEGRSSFGLTDISARSM